MTTASLREGWQRTIPVTIRPLPGGFSLLSLTPPTVLVASDHEDLRRAIVAVSDEAFGTRTARSWEQKFDVGFLGALTCFFLITDSDGVLVGWSGYRACSIAGERVVYFTSTGLLPCCQGCGLLRSVQRMAMAAEADRHPLRPVTLAIRTRNPHAYRLVTRVCGTGLVVPKLDGSVPVDCRTLVRDVASWLDLADVDPATAIVRGAYPNDKGLYGEEPRSSDSAVSNLFARLEPGDALLVLGRPSQRLAPALSHHMRQGAPRSPLAVAAR
jgi:hypothetical protein